MTRRPELPQKITPKETYILLYIWTHEPCRTRDLCKVFRVSRKYIQRLLRKWSQLLWHSGQRGGLHCSWCYNRCRCPRTCWGFHKHSYCLASPLLLRAADYFRRYPKARSVPVHVLLRGIRTLAPDHEDDDFYCQPENPGFEPGKLTTLDQFIGSTEHYWPVDVG